MMPDENVVFTLLQLMCEGDYLPLKNYMRQQDENTTSVCIPVILANILDFLSRRESPLFTHVGNCTSGTPMSKVAYLYSVSIEYNHHTNISPPSNIMMNIGP